MATDVLAPRGTFVTKVFRSKDYNALLFAFNQLFDRVDSTKPVASRHTSAEIFVVCQGYKAPGKIDPKLLDPRHLFAEAPEPPKVVDVLRPSRQKKHREGYEEGVTVLHKVAPVAEFLAADRPAEMLGSVHALTFPAPAPSTSPAPGGRAGGKKGGREEAAAVEGDDEWGSSGHPSTSEEVRTLCSDLRVLGKREFKVLLKVRRSGTGARRERRLSRRRRFPSLSPVFFVGLQFFVLLPCSLAPCSGAWR